MLEGVLYVARAGSMVHRSKAKNRWIINLLLLFNCLVFMATHLIERGGIPRYCCFSVHHCRTTPRLAWMPPLWWLTSHQLCCFTAGIGIVVSDDLHANQSTAATIVAIKFKYIDLITGCDASACTGSHRFHWRTRWPGTDFLIFREYRARCKIICRFHTFSRSSESLLAFLHLSHA